MNIKELVKRGYFAYLGLHEQGYPAAGYEIQLDGEIVRHFCDSDGVVIYDLDEEVIMTLESQEESIPGDVHVFKITKEEVEL